MQPNEFFHVWTDFVGKEIMNVDGFPDAWNSNDRWTNVTIGPPRSEGRMWSEPKNRGNSPFGEYLLAKLGPGWGYWKEERNVDLVLTCAPNFELSDLGNSQGDQPSGFFPRCYDVLVEHESYGWTSWQELLKLIHMRARLKVVITYGDDVGVRNQDPLNSVLTKGILGMFREGIAQAAAEMSEDQRTRYLLIIGYKKVQRIHWRGWSFDASGTVQQMEEKET